MKTGKIRTYLVDDNLHVLETLGTLLEAYEHIEVVGTATNIEEAKIGILATRPKFLLLDVLFPGNTGFELVEELNKVPDYKFYVVLITGIPEYVQPAVEFNSDFVLTKPIHPDGLTKAVNIVSLLIENEMKGNDEPLHFKSKGNDVFIRRSEILWVEAAAHDSILYTSTNEIITVSNSIKTVSDLLGVERFIQTHRSYLVKKDAIWTLSNFTGNIKIKNNTFASEPQLSESRYKAVKDELKKNSEKK
ncbi:MAG TPA: hypothetical protein DCQ31_04815 [Bacteroidales bacterium]|nr:hypothetical protein [Bacteroidales bacterium]